MGPSSSSPASWSLTCSCFCVSPSPGCSVVGGLLSLKTLEIIFLEIVTQSAYFYRTIFVYTNELHGGVNISREARCSDKSSTFLVRRGRAFVTLSLAYDTAGSEELLCLPLRPPSNPRVFMWSINPSLEPGHLYWMYPGSELIKPWVRWPLPWQLTGWHFHLWPTETLHPSVVPWESREQMPPFIFLVLTCTHANFLSPFLAIASFRLLFRSLKTFAVQIKIISWVCLMVMVKIEGVLRVLLSL